MFFFVFKQKTAYEMRISDWSSDVCSSDLRVLLLSEPLNFVIKLPLAGAGRRAAVLILVRGHPITIWQLGDAGSMFRLAPRRQAGVKRQGYRFGRPGPDPGNGGGL